MQFEDQNDLKATPVTLVNFWPSTLEVELNGNSTLGLDGILLENVEPAVCHMFLL